jgi:D-alanine-D-alanine ligase
MKIAVTYSSKQGLLEEYRYRRGTTTAETDIPHDFFAEGDAPETIEAVMAALRAGGHSVFGVEADNQAPQKLEAYRPDLVFNIAEGLWGDFRESYIPLICERLALPYTGSNPLTLAICLNKLRTKEILSYHGISTPRFQVVHPGQRIEILEVSLPAIVKPVAEGSSKGIFNDSVVFTPETLRVRVTTLLEKYHEPVLVESFLTGDEFTVALWGNGAQATVLPIVGINYSRLPEGAQPIYSYEAKWIWDTSENPLEIFSCPAAISPELRREIEELVLRTYRILEVRDWCRIDVRLDAAGKPYILELNPLPGILPKVEDNSCFPKAARTAGYDYHQMLNHVIKIAWLRYER